MRKWDAALASWEGGEDPLPKAAEYIRMSTDQQRYSTVAQSEAIHRYAVERGIAIVRTYEDAGKSGLNIKGRSALSQLIADVQSGSAEFELVLVYDVSRWGRFQDTDESAYYEYICRQNGIHVEYCAEQFSNDGSPLSAVIKSMKRAMAGEYSRELSTKVYAGQTRLIRKGFRQGGRPGFGLRRTLIAEDGSFKCHLQEGDRKSLITDRVILTPGSAAELAIISDIFALFVKQGMSRQAIADDLNRRGVPFSEPGGWTRARVSRVLTNVSYVGDSVWGRTSGKLSRRRVPTQPELWVYARDVFEPVVDRGVFNEAQAIIEAKVCKLSHVEILTRLRCLFQRHGALSAQLINDDPDLPDANACAYRFGGLFRVYELVGHSAPICTSYVGLNRQFKQVRALLIDFIAASLDEAGIPFNRTENANRLTVNQQISLSVHVARCHTLNSGNVRWQTRGFRDKATDINVVVRMDSSNSQIVEYYIIPGCEVTYEDLNIEGINAPDFSAYRYPDLACLPQMLQQTHISEVV